MHYVYIIEGDGGRLYVGMTDDLKRRISEHKEGKVWTTARMGSIELVCYEAFKAKADAIRRERYLKTNKGKRTLKLMLQESLSKQPG